MAKVADARDLKSLGTTRAGSSPAGRITGRYNSHMIKKVGRYRDAGWKAREIAEELNLPRGVVYCLIYRYRHPEKIKAARYNYYTKHRERLNKMVDEWKRKNPDLVEEYKFRNKCNQAGVDWRTG